MKKIQALCIVLIISLSDISAQNNNPLETNFEKGFKVGFKNGYCYGNQGVDCFYPTPPAAPLPGLYESKDSYQDGYNRGFQTGSDLFKSKKEDNRNPYNPPVNKFNPYVPQISAAETSPQYIEAMRRKRESEAAAYAATGALVFDAIANSNDFYIHYLNASDEKNYEFNENISSNGLGFGFRVGKKKSVFEYGASFIQNNIYSESKLKWGAHLNYLFNLPIIKNSNKLNLYLGASLNSFFSKDESIGIGGIGGVNFNVLNWLKIDARYEKTTTTNRISSGILINFNKN